MQAGFGKQVDSPSATAEADVSDAQSVDSSLSRRGTVMSKKDTVCQVGKGPVLQLETGRDVLPVKRFLLSERVVYFFFFFFFFCFLNCIPLFGCTGSSLQYVGSSFLIRDRTQTPCLGNKKS